MEDPGNYKTVSLTSILGKLLEQIIKGSSCKHLMEKEVISAIQHECVKNKSFQTNLIPLFDWE